MVIMWGGSKGVARAIVEFCGTGGGAIDVSLGQTHTAVVSVDKKLYTWMSENSDQAYSREGQLGHGKQTQCRSPKLVESLYTIPISAVACGDHHTVCLADSGKVFAFGSNYFGTLGVGDETMERSTEPIEVPEFKMNPAKLIASGAAHTIVITRSGNVYTWGCGEMGRLGTGNEDDAFRPTEISLPIKSDTTITSCVAGHDVSFLLLSNGKLLAFGCNEHNKLGLNLNLQGVKKGNTKDDPAKPSTISYDTPFECSAKLVKSLLRVRVKSLSAGLHHTAVMDDLGRVYTFGCNRDGQLGQGHSKPCNLLCRVKGLLTTEHVTCVTAGDRYTIVATENGKLFGWGNTEHSRLGGHLDPNLSLSGSGSSSASRTSKPRKLFETQFDVNKLASCGWSTVMVGEKITEQKSVQAASTLVDHAATTENGSSQKLDLSTLDDSIPNEFGVSLSKQETVPAWLQKELAHAMGGLSLNDSHNLRSANQLQASQSIKQDLAVPNQGASLCKSCQSCGGSEVEQFKSQTDKLKAENERLRELVSEKSKRIELLESRLVSTSLSLSSDAENDCLSGLITEFEV